jgi:hypothetical protein
LRNTIVVVFGDIFFLILIMTIYHFFFHSSSSCCHLFENTSARSNEIKNSRLQILKAREEVAYSVLQSAFRELAKLSGDVGEYKKLMKGLIIQALLRIDEQDVEIQCRDADTDLVETILPSLRDEFQKMSGKEITLSVSPKKLPPSPADGHDGPSWYALVVAFIRNDVLT